jgi:pimeloyl-ACP methyl ester carboxylesterase
MNKELQYENNKIFYRIHGKGKPVFLVHGFGEDGEVWNKQVDSLKDKFQFIIPDLPGSGKSDMIDDMTVEGMAETIHAIIHEENIEACPVIGHSMGGYITLALVEKYWNHVSGFGLFHSTAYADSEEKKAVRRKSIEFIKQNGAFEFLKTSTPNLFSPNSKLQMPGAIEDFITSLKDFTKEALIAYYEAMIQRPDRTEILRQTTNPVLFIMGEHDNAVPFKDQLEQSHLPSVSHIHILHQSGHMGMMEEPGTCNKALLNFLTIIP